jgi:transcriptional regulator with XRE-family HTH domain
VATPLPDLSLGAFLRGLRGRLSPERVGLPAGGLRRVPGLRREEVAVLGGLSVDYYTRLEQGREAHPGAAVLDGIASGLDLDDDERSHLFALAGVAPPARSSAASGAVTPALLRLLESWPRHPAFVINPAHDVVATNALARAVYAPFEHFDNLARMTFLDPAARSFHADWHAAADATVASLRAVAGEFSADPRLRALIAQMRAASEEFDERWSAQRVQRKTAASKRFVVDDIGEFALDTHTFTVHGSPGLHLVVYGAAPDSPGARALDRLAHRAPEPALSSSSR